MSDALDRIKARANGHTPAAVPAAVPAAFRVMFEQSRLQPVVETFAGSWQAACPVCCELDYLRLEYAGGRMAVRCTGGCEAAHIGEALGVTLDPLPAAAAPGRPAVPPYTPPAAARAEPSRFAFVDNVAFMRGDFRPEWLVKNVLVKGEPAGMGGPMKALKTSISVDLAVSLASGSPFLNTFAVPRAVRTAVVSGESGKGTLQTLCRRVCAAKGVDADALGNLHWCFDVPCLSDAAGMASFVVGLTATGCEVAFLDPLYLMLGDVNAANLFEAGSLLRGVATTLLAKGVTPVILHHARKVMPIGQPMELADLSHSGFAEFVRQYILLNRSEAYRNDGLHSLLVRIGGSAGHGGMYGLSVDEGTLDEDFGGRKWAVQVVDQAATPPADHAAREAKADERQQAKEAKNRKDMVDRESRVFKAIDSEASKGRPAVTAKRLREHTGWQVRQVNEVVRGMVEDDLIEAYEWQGTKGNGANQLYAGWRRPVPQKVSPPEQGVTDDLPPVRDMFTPCSPGSCGGQGVTGGKDDPPIRGDHLPPPPVPEPPANGVREPIDDSLEEKSPTRPRRGGKKPGKRGGK